MLKYKCSQIPNIMYLEPEPSWVRQDSELNMELCYKDKPYLIGKGNNKLANSISEISKDPKIDLHHYPNITYDQPVIKTNTNFPSLPTKSMISTITAYPNNLTSTTLTPGYKYALLKNIGPAKAKENQMVVTAKNRNEKMNKKISTRKPTFSSSEKQSTTSTIINNNNNHNNNKKNTANSQEKINILITIVLPKADAKFNHAADKEEKAPVPKKVLLRQNTNIEKYPQKNQIRLPEYRDGKSTREFESDNSCNDSHKTHQCCGLV